MSIARPNGGLWFRDPDGSLVNVRDEAAPAPPYAAGQLLTTTLMDYAVPTAADLPAIEVHHLETPAPRLAGGFNGAGEAGAVGAPAAILNAVNDVLATVGRDAHDQPLTPERVLTALRSGGPSRR